VQEHDQLVPLTRDPLHTGVVQQQGVELTHVFGEARVDLPQVLFIRLEPAIPFGVRRLHGGLVGRAESRDQRRCEVFHGFFVAFLRGLSVSSKQ
jgi:hypothetical protein